MFTIRDEQVTRLSSGAREGFIARTLAHLRQDFAKQCDWYDFNRRDLAGLIDKAIDDGAGVGITRQSDVRFFIDCLVLMRTDSGAIAGQYPWAGAILRRPDLDGTAKIDLLHEHVVFAQARQG